MDINNESLGQTVEKVICDLYRLSNKSLYNRSIPELERLISPIVELACRELPPITQHVGLERGLRGGQSKSTVDFVCENKETISIKTTKNSNFKVCPSECGQPGPDTFDNYFGHLYDGNVNYDKFKYVCLNHSHEMMPIYLDHLFDCDYLLWIYLDRPNGFKILKKIDIPNFRWKRELFSFSKNFDTWNESCSVHYKSITIGEYQAHNHRHCYKFRFNLKKLCEILGV